MTALRNFVCVAVFGSLVACASILGIKPPNDKPFPHRAHVLKGVSCATCHAAVSSSTAGSPSDFSTQKACVTCHSQPHDARTCSNCHGRHEDRQRAAEAKLHLRFSHRDHTATTRGRCSRCHDAIASGDGPLRPTMANCLSCHEHRQAWESRACSPCHVNMEAEGTRPASHIVHGRDFMRRHGTEAASSRDLCSSCHAESDCAECHGTRVPALPSVWHFDQVRRADMHAAGFFARHSLEARQDPALCTTCHQDASGCRRCHERQGLLQVTREHASPHPPGWVGAPGAGNSHGREARLNPVSCASCHGGAGEALCVGCHRVGGPGGNPHPRGFHSDKRMSEMPCRMCHLEGL